MGALLQLVVERTVGACTLAAAFQAVAPIVVALYVA
jgi:hypothetical protein